MFTKKVLLETRELKKNLKRIRNNIKTCQRCSKNGVELVKMGWLGNSGFKNGICAKCQYEEK